MLSICFDNSKILKLLKLLMSTAFEQNGPDFALKSRLVAKLFMLVATVTRINFAYITNLQLVWFIKSHFTAD